MPRHGRQRSTGNSLFDDLFHFLVHIPWWAGPPVAGLVYAGLRYGVPALLQAQSAGNVTGQTVSNVFGGAAVQVAPIAALLVLGLWGMALLQKLGDRRRLSANRSIDSIRALDWREFERLLCAAFRRQGYAVEHTGGACADGGVDLVLQRGGKRTLVQCKHWKAQKVGVNVARELYGVVTKEGAAASILVTSGAYTEEAAAFARGIPVTLIDGPELARMIREVQGTPQAAPSAPAPAAATALPTRAPQAQAPPCPKCGAAMVQRTARQGANAGSDFWGCPNYPKCRGTRPVADAAAAR